MRRTVLLIASRNGAEPLKSHASPLANKDQPAVASRGSLHTLGVLCGLTAGVWLARQRRYETGECRFLAFRGLLLHGSGRFYCARWTFLTLLKGTGYIFRDLRSKKHLMVWAILAGALWAVANTLTVFAIRDIGLAIAFPLWNMNSLIGLLWGRLLFRELDGADRATIAKVTGGAVCIVLAATLLGFSTLHAGSGLAHPRAVGGILAAFGASLLWGTMYVPYRKAYLSGMNPLSFITVFTVGELVTMLALVFFFDGGIRSPVFHASHTVPYIFWLFLGGFVWVIGDMFQQFAAKYIGIGRGIPLSNTNQLWGLAWGALVLVGSWRAGIAAAQSHGSLGLRDYDSGRSADQHGAGFCRRAWLTQRGTGARVRPLWHGLRRGSDGAEWR